jgi:hypothetical protein
MSQLSPALKTRTCPHCGFELAIVVDNHTSCVGCGQYDDLRPAELSADSHPGDSSPEPEPEPDRLTAPD